jgi:acyl-CoA synthetase (NDP forming)
MTLSHLLAPRSIALVGASESSRWSRSIVDNLKLQGFPGPVYMVNPRHATEFGQVSYPSVAAIPDEVDLAYVMVPTAAAEAAAADCVAKGVRAVVMLTSGFAEMGEAGAAAQRRLTAYLAEHDVALCGPNCLGYVNANARVAAYALPMAEPSRPGPIGAVLQSGALLLPVLRAMQKREMGLGLLISSGNEAMLDATDYLAHMVEDPQITVLGALLEGIRRPRAFAAVADRALELGKPLVVLKMGRSEVGRRVALAHTGALAGSARFAEALLRRYGVVQVTTLEDLIETLGYLSAYGPPPGERIGLVASSGGTCGLASDLGSDLGLRFPAFAESTREQLRGVLPEFATIQNPLDVTGYVVIQADLATRATRAVAADPNVDVVVNVTAVPEAPGPAPQLVDQRMAEHAELARSTGRYVVFTSTQAGDLTPYGRELVRRHNLYVLGGVAAALRAIRASLDHTRARGRRRPVEAAQAAAKPLPELPADGGPLDEAAAKRLLAAFGLAGPREALAESQQAAVALAREIGFPAVLKVVSPDLPHKTEAGAVALDLRSADEVAVAYDRILANARRHRADARIHGVLVAEQATDGIEMLAGVQVDPLFGPGLVVGLGGIFVEALGDSALRLLPVGRQEARAMVEELRAYAILQGVRGRPPADVEALVGALLALGELAQALGPRLRAIDVNPLLVRGAGRGVLALDALVELHPAAAGQAAAASQ